MIRIWAFIIILTCLPTALFAGNLDSPAVADDPASAMFTVEDIFNRLNSGNIGVKRSGAFTEPASGPSSTGNALDDIMNIAPVADNLDGAVTDNVRCGKTFWGVRTDGTWGQQVGTRSCAYIINVTAGSGGTITPSGDVVVSRYADQTFTITADSGYHITNVQVDGSSIGAAISYTFSNVTQGHAIAAMFAPGELRFVDNGDGTVTDINTGYVWLKDADCFGTKMWTEALSLAANLSNGQCNLTDGSVMGDWSLPEKDNLSSLYDVRFTNPILCNAACTDIWAEGDAFSKVRSDVYWAATEYYDPYDNTESWVVSFSYNYIQGHSKTSSNYVWPIRLRRNPSVITSRAGNGGSISPSGDVSVAFGVDRTFVITPDTGYHVANILVDGQSVGAVNAYTFNSVIDRHIIEVVFADDSLRFTDNGNGTITDGNTGLVWLKDAHCFGNGNPVNWLVANNYAITLSSGECGLTDGSIDGDWRLPEKNELEALIDSSYSNPSLSNAAGLGQWTEGDAFNRVQPSSYWTATEGINNLYHWIVSFYGSGYSDCCYRYTFFNYVWPVRGQAVSP